MASRTYTECKFCMRTEQYDNIRCVSIISFVRFFIEQRSRALCCVCDYFSYYYF